MIDAFLGLGLLRFSEREFWNMVAFCCVGVLNKPACRDTALDYVYRARPVYTSRLVNQIYKSTDSGPTEYGLSMHHRFRHEAGVSVGSLTSACEPRYV